MLWNKMWLETRSRFIVSLTAAVGFCSNIVLRGDRDLGSISGLDDFYRVLTTAHVVLVLVWTVCVTLLMMGGLLREKASGASSFTLALPVSRARLTYISFAMGAIQAITLAIVPWSAMFIIGSTVGKTHSLSQAAFHIGLLLGGGSLFLSTAFLVSSVIDGEYTAPLLAFGLIATLALSFNNERLHPYNPWGLMMGFRYTNERTALLTWPFPASAVGVTLVISAILLTIAVKAIERREF